MSNRASDLPAQRPSSAPAAEPESEATKTDRQHVAAALRALDELAEAAVSSGARATGDCRMAAQLISGPIRRHDGLWQELTAMSRDPDRERLLTDANDDISARMERFVDALGSCAFDRRIHALVEEITFASP